ncbi:hypothetical protein PSI06_21390, partial [Pseudoalteromonas sp. GABNS16E]|nr:hypothetical protein [Pseudoalteromonas sp. GAB2316C]MDC9571494.1 hypothetical protein [Pseudoalteromonas sp. GABNB9D]MDC9575897.1 hypothetical protein [Pseudoalteromonas sp. GABNS16A]MDC9579967.1 hypothetical protein [Pseudoalteromonas sp. GABNS16E]MDC9587726.1 hypothetical protein [Pseudoalteromonas sp. GABNS16C]MDC9603418.1 hypothetical protein [Pseudoalteromonas sp. GABNS16G]MDC9612284.1 hypothetical protein [Pseudoalteromonas sp. GABNS16H]
PLCRAYGVTRQGYYQAMRRIDARNKELEPVKELVMYWRQFMPTAAEEVFVSDITYVKSAQGVHYLSLVTDAYSRKIMGYELS